MKYLIKQKKHKYVIKIRGGGEMLNNNKTQRKEFRDFIEDIETMRENDEISDEEQGFWLGEEDLWLNDE